LRKAAKGLGATRQTHNPQAGGKGVIVWGGKNPQAFSGIAESKGRFRKSEESTEPYREIQHKKGNPTNREKKPRRPRINAKVKISETIQGKKRCGRRIVKHGF